MAEPLTVPYTGQKRHRLRIHPLGEITLPIVRARQDIHIASFVLIDNYDLVKKLSAVLARQVAKYDPDYLLCVEAKSLPLTYAICDCLNDLHHKRGRRTKVRFVVVRKSKKVYMKSPYSVTMKSITSRGQQKLFINRSDVAKLRKQRFVLIDDVISTGSTVNSLLRLLKRVDLSPSAICTVLFEGETGPENINYPYKNNIHALGRIPLYVKE
jgi:adenine phosphoribosyltransferase